STLSQNFIKKFYDCFINKLNPFSKNSFKKTNQNFKTSKFIFKFNYLLKTFIDSKKIELILKIDKN
ncbi:hypothetical protein TUBRATIS_22640, partial [Tubulinosema ratisbonensis]